MEGSKKNAGSKFVWQTITVGLLLIALVFGYGTWVTGSVSKALPYFSGQGLFVESDDINLGAIPLGKADLVVEINLLNLSSDTISVIGAKTSCSCMQLGDFPVSLSPGQKHALKIEYLPSDKTGAFEHKVLLFTDEPGFTTREVSIDGVVVENNSGGVELGKGMISEPIGADESGGENPADKKNGLDGEINRGIANGSETNEAGGM